MRLALPLLAVLPACGTVYTRPVTPLSLDEAVARLRPGNAVLVSFSQTPELYLVDVVLTDSTFRFLRRGSRVWYERPRAEVVRLTQVHSPMRNGVLRIGIPATSYIGGAVLGAASAGCRKGEVGLCGLGHALAGGFVGALAGTVAQYKWVKDRAEVLYDASLAPGR